MDDTLPSAAGPSWRWIAGVSAMVLLGMIAGLAAQVVTFVLTYDAINTTWLSYGLLYTVFTVPVAANALLRCGRYGRAFGVGLIGTWAVLVAWMWVESRGTSMSSADVDEVIDGLVASDFPAYYLGDDADGVALSSAEDGVQGKAYFEYGRCKGGPSWITESTCWPDIYVYTSPSVWLSHHDDCRRMSPLLGAPTALLDEGEFSEPVLALFTGRMMVLIALGEVESGDAEPDVERQRELAGQLRPVGQAEPVAALPDPEPEAMRKIDRICELSP